MSKVLLSVVVLALLAAVPATACFQQCQYSGGGDECVTKGYVTNQSCYMSGPTCIETPEYGCWAPKPEEEVAAWLAPTEAPVCQEGLTTAAE